MANLITGILIGGAAVWLYHLSQGTHVITWFGWLLFTLGGSIACLWSGCVYRLADRT